MVEAPRAAWIESLIAAGYPQALGVDPSQSHTGDKAGQAHMVGPHLASLSEAPCPDSTLLGVEVWAKARTLGVGLEAIGVDPVGVGAGTVNYLRKVARESKLPVTVPELQPSFTPVERVAKSGEAAEWEPDANLFYNLRAQMYWQLAEDFRLDRLTVPPHKGLEKQLATVTYTPKNGKVLIMSKEEFRDKHGFSPNELDAFVYANWVRYRELPRDEPLPVPDHHHLGFKKSGGRVVPKTGEDIFREQTGGNRKRPGVGKWW